MYAKLGEKTWDDESQKKKLQHSTQKSSSFMQISRQ